MSSHYLPLISIDPTPENQLIIAADLPATGDLSGWEQDDPCRYANQSCRGKMFGALKSCRRQREKSQALCKAHEQKLAEQKTLEQQKQQLTVALQNNLTDTAAKQQTASTAMIAGAAVGGVAIMGVALMLIAKKKKAKPKSA